MIGAGLAPEQGPPFTAPLRFFLTAPWFLVAAGLLAAFDPGWTEGPLSPTALALTHLLTLGFLGMVMLGALTQMLPVLAGAPMPGIRPVAAIGHASLTLGTPLLAWGLWRGEPAALLHGAGLLWLGLAPLLISAGLALADARRLDSVHAMRVAFVALLATLALGLGLAGWLADALPAGWRPDAPFIWLRAHALAGLAGWVAILVVGVAWQVVPMLQVTPAYPAWATRPLLVVLTSAVGVALLAPAPWRVVGEIALALGLAAFALVTLDLQRRRKRKLASPTLDLWRLGMLGLIGAVALFALPLPGEPARVAGGVLFLVGFAASVVIGMLDKIVPFLAWFHLRAGLGTSAGALPGMKDFLSDAAARRQARLHLVALVCLVAAPFAPALAVPGGLLLAAAGAVAGWNLARAARLYARHRR